MLPLRPERRSFRTKLKMISDKTERIIQSNMVDSWIDCIKSDMEAIRAAEDRIADPMKEIREVLKEIRR